MRSISSVYKIGNGPSSSHTVGPYNAASRMKKSFPHADRIVVTLQGSLAMTGEGHSTAKAIRSAIPEAEVLFDREAMELPHPNTMVFDIYKDGELIHHNRIFSIGGGSIRYETGNSYDEKVIYKEKNFTEMMAVCQRRGITLVQFIYEHEGEYLKEYLRTIWNAMKSEVESGLAAEGVLPGGLNVTRKAKLLYEKRVYNESSDVTQNRIVSAYAYAAAEQNADEEIVVTAPTCGSCGVIPAVFYYMWHERGFHEDEIIDALAVAGLIGNIIRTNASISGAEAGCQAEIGSACSMAAAGLASLYRLSIEEIEYAAENAMEHQLGLTCDPVCGLVQIPCIERNAVAAMRAMSAVNLSQFLFATRKISFDEVIATMYQTGKDMNDKYRETSHGGLAVIHKEPKAGEENP